MTNNTGDTLKACPFCGGEAERIPSGFVNEFDASCKKCGAMASVNIWNTRTHPQPTGDRGAAIDLNNGVRERVIEKISKLKIKHTECEDNWYSCPKSEEGCCDDRQTGCTCGADNQNAIIDDCLALLAGDE